MNHINSNKPVAKLRRDAKNLYNGNHLPSINDIEVSQVCDGGPDR